MSTNPPPLFPDSAFDVVCIGASAGGLRALLNLVAELPGDFPCAVVVVQHLDPRHESVMHELLGRRAKMRVVQAKDGDRLRPGTLFMAPPDWHLLVNDDGALSLSHTALVHFVRPSVDLLFESAAGAYGDRVVAVVLTGTGRDGSLGVEAVKERGGTVVVQDPGDAEFTGMPEAALAQIGADLVLPLGEIGLALIRLVRGDAS